jgi:hypothetical protein
MLALTSLLVIPDKQVNPAIQPLQIQQSQLSNSLIWDAELVGPYQIPAQQA